MLEELLWRQTARLPPIEDRLDDIRREIAEADEAGKVGPANTFPLGECSKGDAFTLGECRVEPARPEKQLYQSRIRFRGGKRIGAVHHHSDLPPGAPRGSRSVDAAGIEKPSVHPIAYTLFDLCGRDPQRRGVLGPILCDQRA